MIDLAKSKAEILGSLHTELRDASDKIASSNESRHEKAKAVNSLIGAMRIKLSQRVHELPKEDKPNYALILQYCCSVASLEYRHKVWPYEYMAFSRRVGELWESFCSAAWEYPSRPAVAPLPVPSFKTVRKTIADRIERNVGAHANKTVLLEDIALLFEIIGEINMKEDKVFSVDKIPHVIDFKSGFGSNEKGNMLRLQTVGRAYRLWDHQTRLLLLVRQEANNNYLNVLKRAGLWEVYTGQAAYKEVANLTGADVQTVRNSVIAWQEDLSPQLYTFLKDGGLLGYLAW